MFDHKIESFASIVKFSFDLINKDSDLEFETKFTQIRHELTEIHQFQNYEKLISTVRIWPILRLLILTMLVHCKEIFVEEKLK